VTTPQQGRPDQSVDPNAGFQISSSFNQLVTSIQALQQTINNQVSFQERQANAQARYSAAGIEHLPQISDAALQGITRAGGMTEGMSGQTSMMTGTGALSSLQNLQTYTSQRLGAWMAGAPLLTAPGGGGMFNQRGAGPNTPAGATPAGTPNSTWAPAGSGAAAAAAAAGGSSGAAPPPAGNPLWTPPPPGGAPGAPPAVSGGLASAQNPALQLLGTRLAMSGGTRSGISAAIRGLPGVGLLSDILGAVGSAGNIFQSQFAQGRNYQEFEGGTNLGGQAERVHQAIYQASMAFSPLGSGAAGAAFQGVSELGYNRAAGFQTTSGNQGTGNQGNYAQDRQGALNFVYNQYTQSGASVQQTLETLAIASQNSTVNLGNLNTILNNLSKTAGEAGSNAEAMRTSFQQAFQTAVSGGAAAGAPSLAGAVTGTQASYGQAFAGTSFAGELSQGRQYLLAGQYGISPGQAQYISRNAPQQYANMISGQNLSFIQQLPGMTSQALASLQQMISQYGGSPNPDQVNSIATAWLNQWQVPNDINLDVWAQVLSQLTGVNVSAGNVMQFVVQQVAGNNEASQAASQPSSAASGTASGSATVSASSTSGAVTGQYGLAQATSATPVAGRAGVLGATTGGSQTWQQVLASHAGTAAQAYLAEEKKSGQRSPVLEALLQNTTQSDQVQVQTKDGPRVMSLTDAMKYYPDELMSGNVMVYNGKGTQMLGTTASITHGLSAQDTAGIEAEERGAAGSKSGVSAAQFKKTHPKITNASTGATVKVDLSNEAKQLLKVLPTNYDAASASGTVPAVPWPSTSSR
jgi:hypothetical protein